MSVGRLSVQISHQEMQQKFYQLKKAKEGQSLTYPKKAFTFHRGNCHVSYMTLPCVQ